MGRVSAEQLRKEKDVRKDYQAMIKEIEYGVRKYTYSYILRHLAHKYYVSTVTISNYLHGGTERRRKKLKGKYQILDQ